METNSVTDSSISSFCGSTTSTTGCDIGFASIKIGSDIAITGFATSTNSIWGSIIFLTAGCSISGSLMVTISASTTIGFIGLSGLTICFASGIETGSTTFFGAASVKSSIGCTTGSSVTSGSTS